MSGLEMMTQGSVLFITLFVMLLGLIFTFIPILPGTLIIWGAVLAYGLVLGWSELGWFSFILITFFMILGVVADALAGHFGAKAGGASWLAIIGGAVLGFVLGIIASLVGSPIFGCFAGLLGAVAGVLLIEWSRQDSWPRAIQATQGYVAGAAVGIMVKVVTGFVMIGIFLARVYLWP